MVFSSNFFLFAFLPAAIICYYAQRLLFNNRLRNAVLLVFSYLFYLYGAAGFLLILVLSTLADYLFGLLIDRDRCRKRLWLSFSVLLNIGLLAYFKYANFFIRELGGALQYLGFSPAGWENVILPIGISFFTFQKLSYVIDVYRGKSRALVNVVDFALYVAMFSQLIAGPIIRFKDIRNQLKDRKESWDLFYMGTIRFCWGLSKKVIIADSCGRIADVVFGLGMPSLDTKTAWLGCFAYGLQIYVDFSAYSDMALGLGMLFGFKFLENFNLPYSAISISDFWRRWHISLSQWFKDYLYVPLGGNRQGTVRTYLNLMAVFILCGIWHGANWTFLLWGLYHGVFLMIERATRLRNISPQRYTFVRRAVTLFIVMVGWVLFRSEDIFQAKDFLEVMFTPINLPLSYELSLALNYRNVIFMLTAAISFLLPVRFSGTEFLMSHKRPMWVIAGLIAILVLLPYSVALIAGGSNTPFIYYRF
jgi:alginate O-acetyltransferase complex protein AlgI